MNASPAKCSATLPRACSTEARSFRTAWSFSQSGPSAMAREAAEGEGRGEEGRTGEGRRGEDRGGVKRGGQGRGEEVRLRSGD